MSAPLVDQAIVWAWLRVDLVDDGQSPSGQAPVDAEFIEELILAAELRLETFMSSTLAEIIYESDAIPAPLVHAVCLDVAAHYFSRVSPELPDAYFDAIQPWRAWSFGA